MKKILVKMIVLGMSLGLTTTPVMAENRSDSGMITGTKLFAEEELGS